MSGQEDLRKAQERPDDLIAAVLLDHAEIKDLFAQVHSATGEQKEEAFRWLTRKLVVHETAEQEVVHPLAQDVDQGGPVVDARLHEEKAGTEALTELEKIGVGDPQFDSKLTQLEQDVLQHAEREEQFEHPRIDQSADPDQLRNLAPVFRAAEASAPTHPHPHGPTSQAGNVVVGPVVAIVDRARDAVRDAKKRMQS